MSGNGEPGPGTPGPIWTPDPAVAARSGLAAFQAWCGERTGRNRPDWQAFQRWSVASFRDFWALFLEWSGLAFGGDPSEVCRGDAVETATFFPDLRLSYAENLLRPLPGAGDGAEAVRFADEAGAREVLARGELRRRVRAVAEGLRRLGLREGDRVVAIARNDAAGNVACLAATSLGAAWSSVSPDIGTGAVLARFTQLDPTVLFCCGSYPYQGVPRPIGDRVRELAAAIPSLRQVVALDPDPATGEGTGRPVATLADLALTPADDPAPWPRFPFNQPLFILFSSGTTGAPKCIVHGAGGTLLQHVKEHRLHCDLRPGDRLFFATSAGWMMWNWQISCLASGITSVLRDGSATHPTDDALWRFAADEGVTAFGTSAAYVQYLRDAEIVPRERADLSRLRSIMSTGSVLPDSAYPWARDNVGRVPVQSISGGTDLVGCFVLGNPALPVWPGEAQCLGLGMDVAALGPDGLPVTDAPGELVCRTPFPSRPVRFWNDPEGKRFHDAYFAQNEGVWTHGDRVVLTGRGTARVLGRSDGVLNVRGIRIGPAEITTVATTFEQVRAAMALEQAAPREPGGSRLVLLLVMAPGAALDRPLVLRIKKELSTRCSMNHVPAVVAAVPDLPATFNGKVSERAARDVLNGRPVENLAALRNPESLDAIRAHPDLAVR
ncbi:MAG: acetoacetate--CoA ligase [Deltaproteobacteria bacterium]|nr:acetoacetate--CoA ligase [Deltaproteobacteria bacterium]